MNQQIIAELCAEAAEGILDYRPHYEIKLMQRSTPSKRQVAFMLCEDAPEVIDERPEEDVLIIWGTTQDGRIGHVVCKYYPVYEVLTAYFPGETEPYKWEDDTYRTRRIPPGERYDLL